MRLRELRLQDLRGFRSVELELDPGWNVLVGANGAGKTTLLEAAYLLSHGRTFRGGGREALIRRGAEGYSVYGRIETSVATHGVGLLRKNGIVEARIDGAPAALADLLRHVGVVCFEPGSHELISGAAEGRRRFLDWGVFHVEPEFLRTWRSYQRALRQRNALLRAGGSAAELDPWDRELAGSGTELAAMRGRYVAAFEPLAIETLHGLLGELGPARITLESGWRGEGDPREILAATREEDIARGHTTRGPHRADWAIAFERAPRREHLSRGQEKLCALGCIMGQARVFAAQCGEWPVVCIDDLASELDAPHQEVLVQSLRGFDTQILITGTHESGAFGTARTDIARFHVEPGRVARLL